MTARPNEQAIGLANQVVNAGAVSAGIQHIIQRTEIVFQTLTWSCASLAGLLVLKLVLG